MRGRKRVGHLSDRTVVRFIKKESPNEGTETSSAVPLLLLLVIKKESPNEGTETIFCKFLECHVNNLIKKESPNEGTETPDRQATF